MDGPATPREDEQVRRRRRSRTTAIQRGWHREASRWACRAHLLSPSFREVDMPFNGKHALPPMTWAAAERPLRTRACRFVAWLRGVGGANQFEVRTMATYMMHVRRVGHEVSGRPIRSSCSDAHHAACLRAHARTPLPRMQGCGQAIEDIAGSGSARHRSLKLYNGGRHTGPKVVEKVRV